MIFVVSWMMNWLFSSTLREPGVPLLERVDLFALHAGDFAHAVLGLLELRDLGREPALFSGEVADLHLEVLVLEVRVHELAHGFVDRVLEAHERDLVGILDHPAARGDRGSIHELQRGRGLADLVREGEGHHLLDAELARDHAAVLEDLRDEGRG